MNLSENGVLSLEELEDVMRACLKESGMQLPESQVKELAFVLVQEAKDNWDEDEDDFEDEDDDLGGYFNINIDQFKRVMTSHEGLLDNLNLNMASWLLPPRAPKQSKHKVSSTLSILIEESHIIN